MSQNFDVVVPFDSKIVAGFHLTTADTTYDGGTATVIYTATKLVRIPWIYLAARGTNANPGLVRLHKVEPSGGIAPLHRDIPFPATTANTTVPLWARRIRVPGLVLPVGAQIRAQITVNAAAGISVSFIPQLMEKP